LLGHLTLRQAALEAHAPQAWPDPDFAFRHLCCSTRCLLALLETFGLMLSPIIPQRRKIYKIYNMTFDNIFFVT